MSEELLAYYAEVRRKAMAEHLEEMIDFDLEKS